MVEFLARHQYIIIWIGALLFCGAAAYGIFYFNGYVPPIPIPGLVAPASSGNSSAASPNQAGATTITFTVQKSAAGNTFTVHWENLPSGTTALNIYRGQSGTPQDGWSLWKTVTIPSGDLSGGNASFNIGNNDESGYAFYAEATGDNSDNASGTNNGTPPLWTSSSTTPVVTIGGNPPDNGNPPPGNEPSSTPSSTPPNTPPSNPSSTPSNPSSTNPNNPSNPSSSPSGIPYYNPQVQISGYGTLAGSFWVQRVNQSIEIGWQNLPSGITSITVARSTSSTGPWNTILAQANPGTTGSYSIEIVDNTVHDPYYYDMTALNGTTTIATYGPEYVAGN